MIGITWGYTIKCVIKRGNCIYINPSNNGGVTLFLICCQQVSLEKHVNFTHKPSRIQEIQNQLKYN
jgi:hypothetical protein